MRLLLALLLAPAALAADPLCAQHACSNDTLGVFGDEALRWSPASGMVTAYEIWRSGDAAPCVIVAGDVTTLRVAGTLCLAFRDDRFPSPEEHRAYGLRVRACNGSDQSSPAACGGFSAPVEFVVPGCVEHRSTCWLYPDGSTDCPSCTRACYADQPLPLPLSQRYEVCP